MKRKIPALLLRCSLFFQQRSPQARRVTAARSGRGRPTAGNSSSVTASASAAAIRRPALRRSRNSRPSRSSPPSRRSRLNPEQPSEPSGGASVSSYEQQVAALVNAERAKYGLAALTLDETLLPLCPRQIAGYARSGLLLPHQPDLWLPV